MSTRPLGLSARLLHALGVLLLVATSAIAGPAAAQPKTEATEADPKSGPASPSGDAVVVTSEQLRKMDVAALATMLADLDRKLAYLSSEADRQAYDAPNLRSLLTRRRDLASSFRTVYTSASNVDCRDPERKAEARRFLAQVSSLEGELSEGAGYLDDDALIRVNRVERALLQELKVMAQLQGEVKADANVASRRPESTPKVGAAKEPEPPPGESVPGCLIAVDTIGSGRFDTLIRDYDAAIEDAQGNRSSKRREGLTAQLRETNKTRTEVLDELNGRASAGTAIAKLPLVVVFLGVFSLAIMVMVQRFRPEVQATWVSSGQVVQFMTVTVLIIVVLVLGLATTLKGETVGTLIGSIGGYVLSQGIGRFVNRDKKERENEEATKPREKADATQPPPATTPPRDGQQGPGGAAGTPPPPETPAHAGAPA